MFTFQLSDCSAESKLSYMSVVRCYLSELGKRLLKNVFLKLQHIDFTANPQ